MKLILIFLFSLLSLSSFSQTNDTLKTEFIKTLDSVSFVTVLDIANASKDGIYLNSYVVNIDYYKAKKLHGKSIRVTGKVTILKGIKNLPGQDIKQGREVETKYIESPKIEILKN